MAHSLRSLYAVFAVTMLAIALSACGGGKKDSSGGDEPASVSDISGTYLVVQDSDGQKPREGASVTLVLNDDGTLTVHAVADDDELNDTGSYSIADGLMTIVFTDQQLSATARPYKLEGDTLEIPIKMFSEGEGSSIWAREGSQAAGDDDDDQPSASGDLESDWDAWDLKKDAGAAATKHFVEAVNDDDMAWEQAVQETATFALTLPDVKEANVSPNGLNITILYEDGTGDYVVTERTIFGADETAAIDSSSGQRLVSTQPIAGQPESLDAFATDRGCAALPGSPSSNRPPEPGREGLHPAGGFGVNLYDAGLQPKPVNSADTPPKRALLVSPAYELGHPLRGAGGKVVFYESFKDAVGPSIECMQEDLTRAGYQVDTILGTTENGKPVHTGDQAVEELGKFLTTNKYGVFYTMSHGTNIDNWRMLHSQSWMYLGLMDIDRNELKDALNGRKLSKDTHEDIVIALAKLSGLTWDGSGDAPFVIGADFQGSAIVWVTPAYFEMMRSEKGVSFDKTLVFLNTCSSAGDSTLSDAFKAKAFFGWGIPMDGVFISDAAETMFDSMTDKARSARNAWAMWRRHEAWKIDLNGTPEDNAHIDQMKPLGALNLPYDPMTSQTVILIYRLRHGPSSASSDLAQSMLVVKACSEQFWSQGKRTGLASPACHNLEFGNQLPTVAEVEDALFEVGGPGTKPHGRWTMAD